MERTRIEKLDAMTKSSGASIPHKDEYQRNSVKLQNAVFQTSQANERIQQLEQENNYLREEIEVLRTVPHPDSIPQPTQVQELTLSLRKLSEKLSQTENVVLSLTNQLNNVKSEAVKAKMAEERAYELAARIRGREEALKQRERQLEHEVRLAEEKAKMADLAVSEYANLVRSMTDKSSDGPVKTAAASLANGFVEGKGMLAQLMRERREEAERLEQQIDKLQAEFAILEARLDEERKGAELDREARSQAEAEVERLQVEDRTAAKMVSRYMKFSQAQTDTLQTNIASLKTRHSATVNTLTSKAYNLTAQLEASQAQVERFRNALDELGGDLMKESFGRRHEVATRIRMLSREERLHENIQRWLLRSEEALLRLPTDTPEHDALARINREAHTILSGLHPPSIPSPDGRQETSVSGSMGRLLVADWLVQELKKEFQVEKSRQLQLRRLVVELGGQVPNDIQPEDEWIPPEGWMSGDVAPTSQPPVKRRSPHRPAPISLSPTPRSPQTRTSTRSNSPVSPVLLADSELKSTIDIVVQPPESPKTLQRTSSLPPEVPNPWETPIHTDDTSVLENTPVPFPVSQSAPSSPKISPRRTATVHSVVELTPTMRPKELHNTSPTPSQPSSPSTPLLTLTQSLPDGSTSESALAVQLLHGLKRIGRRYDDLQRGFRDCQLGLESLRESVVQASASRTPTPIPTEVLQVVLDRLNDFIEDARVELEIQVSDEELLARGYETLLVVPGAISAPGTPSSATFNLDSPSIPPGPRRRSDVEEQVQAFVSGTDANVRKARETFQRKLDDAQHDIAAIKRAIHGPDSDPAPPAAWPSTPRTPKTSPKSSFSELLNTTPRHQAIPLAHSTSSPLPSSTKTPSTSTSSWKSWIRNASSPTTATPPTPPATFGDIMTSPRLRHSPSLQSGLRTPSSAAPSSQATSASGSNSNSSADVLASLELKVPMPRIEPSAPTNSTTPATSASPGPSPLGDGVGVGAFRTFDLGSRPGMSPIGTAPRARAISNMYMLGLGGASARGGAFAGVGGPTRPRAASNQVPPSTSSLGLAASPFGGSVVGSGGGGGGDLQAWGSGRAEREIDGETDVETDNEGSDTDLE
ncbi:hypothetical protein CC1G_08297 [Coprinopsis cinerea okayama7|uniref:Uncharacterized protein n=1 Tax=Coprinopsis cinerea (strain Okayama-7 / 130 / ATCC MYA-4618 / FGSC 9003) TaxID=240176 RepID=A8PG58_COPC7|nr:hypothetical protein CC1G_08297 [Coprinopsis cinerea okayama7\|eukprot:XP_001841153.2 hypothetical protein CC1G_08297 [Coprinopsis cinerea okayama7\